MPPKSTSIESLVTNFNNLPVEVFSNHSLFIDYDSNSNPIYIGIAVAGSPTSSALWQIRHLTFDGGNNVTSILYAQGNTLFDKKWDSRATYSYN